MYVYIYISYMYIYISYIYIYIYIYRDPSTQSALPLRPRLLTAQFARVSCARLPSASVIALASSPLSYSAAPCLN